MDMDFSGDTIVDAKNRLWSFVEQTCEGLKIPLKENGGIHTDVNATSVRLSGSGNSSFYLETNIVDDKLAQAKTAPDPEKNMFGGGHILKRGAHIMLELRRDEDHRYRWWGAPLLLDAEVMSVIPTTDGRPFVLTQEYVADGLKSLQERKR